MVCGVAPLLAVRSSDWPEIIVFLLLVAFWALRKKEAPKETEGRTPRADPTPHPNAPPPLPAERRLPGAPTPTSHRPSRPVGRTSSRPLPGYSSASPAGASAPLSDYAATRTSQANPKAEKPGASAPMPPVHRPPATAGRALLRLGDVPKRDRVRAALAWSVVLGPPRALDRGLPGRARTRR